MNIKIVGIFVAIVLGILMFYGIKNQSKSSVAEINITKKTKEQPIQKIAKVKMGVNEHNTVKKAQTTLSNVVSDWNKFIKNINNNREIFDYFDSLKEEEIFELFEYFAQETNTAIIENFLIPHLKTRWSNGLPFDRLISLSKDKDKNELFRIILIDILTSNTWAATDEKINLILKSYKKSISDRSNSEEYRSVLIRKLSKLLSDKNSYGDEYKSLFLKNLKNNKINSKIVNASIVTLRRMDAKEAIPIIKDICSSYTSSSIEEDETIRYAIVALSKYAKKGSIEPPIEEIRHILKTTQNNRVFASTLYSIRILSNKELFYSVFSDIMDASKKFQDRLSMKSAKRVLMKYKDKLQELQGIYPRYANELSKMLQKQPKERINE